MDLDEQQIGARLIGEFGEDLWLNRRLDLGPVKALLESLLESMDDQGSIGQAQRERLKAWRGFIQFLADQCSGREFSDDKQWSELLNLMQVSRKFNHRSVKFKELLKQRRLIEANSRPIERLNESARLASSIGVSLKQLELLIGAARLEADSSGLEQGASKHLASSSSIVSENLLDTERHLQNSCRPLCTNLRLELDSELAAACGQARLAAWRSSLHYLSEQLELLVDFLRRLRQLLTSLARLIPLLNAVTESDEGPVGGSTPESLAQISLQSSLDECRIKFSTSIHFYRRQLNPALVRLAQAAASKRKSASRTSGAPSSRVSTNASSSKQQVAGVRLIDLIETPERHSTASLKYSQQVFGAELDLALEQARGCELKLDELMQNLRLEFGRFYFLNDLELLEVIALNWRLFMRANKQNGERLIRKLFNNSISSFELDAGESEIVGLISPLGERIRLLDCEPVKLRKRVNVYSLELVRILQELLRKLKQTLRNLFERAARQPLAAAPSSDLVWSLPVQLMCLLDQLRFTQRLEACLSASKSAPDCQSLAELLDKYEFRLRQLSAAELNCQASQSGALSQLKRSASISLSVQFVCILQRLIECKISTCCEWEWQKLARFYLLDAGHTDKSWRLEVRLASAKFLYKFHYLPIELASHSSQQVATYKRLIGTKTSDRCLLLASQAVAKLRLGASPFGPAGSGKTETIKTLGRLVGVQVLVHNCDETNEARALERLVWGLAHTGLWGCFDEFNRLSAGTLSSLSGVLEQVQSSLRAANGCAFAGSSELRSLDEDSAFFITLNPRTSEARNSPGRLYLGRRELPANLRSLFLPVSMCSVQVGAIVGELLLIEQHESTTRAQSAKTARLTASDSRSLGLKLEALLDRLKASEALAEEPCEWDLRLVLVILRRFKTMLLDVSEKVEPEVPIDCVMAKAVEMELSARMGSSQALRELNKTLESVFELQAKPLEVGRISRVEKRPSRESQLLQQLASRPGVIVLGPSKSGKTRAWRRAVESSSSGEQGANINCFVLSPVACSKETLFGSFAQNAGNKWKDGLLTCIVRRALSVLAASSHKAHQVWLVLDGAIEPQWVECLNSALDDNQVLTLSSGERLSLAPSQTHCIKLIFETTSLKLVSPATISRLGLINLSLGADERDPKDDLEPEPHSPDRRINVIVSSSQKLTHQLSCYTNLMAHLKESEQQVVEYVCFAEATSEHLLDLLNRLPISSTRIRLVLHGFERLEEETESMSYSDNLQFSSTFGEHLRFMLSHGFYYNLLDTSDRIDLEKKLHSELEFWLSVAKPIELHLSDRLMSLSNHSSAAINAEQKTGNAEKTFNCIDLDQICQLPETNQPLVACIVCERLALEFELILARMSQTFNKIERFSSHSRILRCIELLDKLSNGMLEADSRDDKRLFLINQVELIHLNKWQRAQLMHNLNLLLNVQQNKALNLIYVSEGDLDSSDAHLACFSLMSMKSVGQIYQLKPMELCSGISNHISMLDRTEREWLELKVNQLAELYRTSSVELLEFRKTLGDAIERASANLANQREALSNALSSLSKFDSQISRVKERRTEEEKQVGERKSKLESMIELIDMQLRNSQEQQRQIEQLKGLQSNKSQEIERQSRRIELELESVNQLIEANKLEINKCLQMELLNEIKSLRQPPRVMKQILELLILLLAWPDESPGKQAATEPDFSSWTFIRSYLNKCSLKDELASFDAKKRLSSKLLAKLESEVVPRRESLTREQASRASSAALPLVNWIEAIRQYGKVLTRMRPLEEAKQKLELEWHQMSSSMQELESKQREINSKVVGEQKELERMKVELREAEQRSAKVARELERLQQVRESLLHQQERWASKQRLCKLLGEPRKFGRLCLLATQLACLRGCASPAEQWRNEIGLERVLTLLEFDQQLVSDGQRAVLANVLSALCEQISPSGILKFASSSESKQQLERIADLVSIRLNLFELSGRKSRLPVLGLPNRKCAPAQLVEQHLGQQAIVCDRSPVVLSVEPSSLALDSRLLQEAELAWSAGRIVAFDLRECRSDDSIWLEAMDLCRAGGSKRVSLLVGSPARPLLAGVRSLTLSGSDEADSAESIRERLTRALVKLSQPELECRVVELEAELEEKEQQVRRAETELIARLAQLEASGAEKCDETKANSLMMASPLIEALNGMQVLQQQLGVAIEQIESRLGELKLKRKQQFRWANQIAQLLNELASNRELSQLWFPFERQPSVEFCARAVLAARAQGDTIDHQRLLADLMRPLSLEAREKFSNFIKSSPNSLDVIWTSLDLTNVLKQSAELERALLHLVHELEDSSEAADHFRLALILHDSKKPSPQMQIDGLFSSAKLAKRLQFTKSYASGSSLEGHSSTWQSSTLGAIGALNEETRLQADQQQQVPIRCVCLANAHLAGQWLSERLVSELKRVLASVGRAKSKQLLLLVLVGEIEFAEGASRCPFGASLREMAHLQQWHDDLALSMQQRFDLLANLLRDYKRNQLIKSKLILVHIVCQELTKLAQRGWRRPCSYSFELNLILFAELLLDEQAEPTSSAAMNLFVAQLETVVYGAQMDEPKDEELLKNLLRVLILNTEYSANLLDELKSGRFDLEKVLSRE